MSTMSAISTRLKPALTPRETLGFWAALRGIDRAPAIDGLALRARAVADRPCGWLSAGQRRRLRWPASSRRGADLAARQPTAALDSDGEAGSHLIAEHRRQAARALATHQHWR